MRRAPASGAAQPAFRSALAQVWAEPRARRFAIFVFVSMLAYSAQDLILEPFAGLVFGLTPGEIDAAVRRAARRRPRSAWCSWRSRRLPPRPPHALAAQLDDRRLRRLGAGAATLAPPAIVGPAWPLRAAVFALGVANGAFAIAAIGSMMGLAGSAAASREGVRMGVWGAAQAVAFGLGGFAGTAASDLGASSSSTRRRRLTRSCSPPRRAVSGRGLPRRRCASRGAHAVYRALSRSARYAASRR